MSESCAGNQDQSELKEQLRAPVLAERPVRRVVVVVAVAVAAAAAVRAPGRVGVVGRDADVVGAVVAAARDA